jgi:hypothetical protein
MGLLRDQVEADSACPAVYTPDTYFTLSVDFSRKGARLERDAEASLPRASSKPRAYLAYRFARRRRQKRWGRNASSHGVPRVVSGESDLIRVSGQAVDVFPLMRILDGKGFHTAGASSFSSWRVERALEREN